MYCFILCISFSISRMSDETFDLIRFSLIPVFCLLRFCLTTIHLQSHLNMAKERFDNMKMEAGRITSLELQKMVGPPIIMSSLFISRDSQCAHIHPVGAEGILSMFSFPTGICDSGKVLSNIANQLLASVHRTVTRFLSMIV